MYKIDNFCSYLMTQTNKAAGIIEIKHLYILIDRDNNYQFTNVLFPN